jgi:hypothetical protein
MGRVCCNPFRFTADQLPNILIQSTYDTLFILLCMSYVNSTVLDACFFYINGTFSLAIAICCGTVLHVSICICCLGYQNHYTNDWQKLTGRKGFLRVCLDD